MRKVFALIDASTGLYVNDIYPPPESKLVKVKSRNAHMYIEKNIFLILLLKITADKYKRKKYFYIKNRPLLLEK